MPRLALPLFAAACLLGAASAHAESLSCQTINGQTTCIHGPETRCQTDGNRITCRSMTEPQQAPDSEDPATEDDHPSDQQTLSIDPGMGGQRLRIEQHTGGGQQLLLIGPSGD